MKQKKAIINQIGFYAMIIILSMVVFLIIGHAISGTFIDDENRPDNPARKIECDITIRDPIGFGRLQPEIETFDCNLLMPCNKFFSASITPLAIFSNKGVVKMLMGTQLAKSDYKTFRLGGKDIVSLSLCTEYREGMIKITDEKGNTIDKKQFSVE